MTETQVFYANVLSNVVALLMLVACWRSRSLGRFLFFALFLWASLVNLRLALWDPTAYLEYARWATGPYRRFILGPFSRHTGLFVGAIAVGQLAIAALVAARGRAVALGLAGAIVFLLAIAPLGRGSAFPFSLVAAAAAALLLRQPFEHPLAREALSAAARLRARLWVPRRPMPPTRRRAS